MLDLPSEVTLGSLKNQQAKKKKKSQQANHNHLLEDDCLILAFL